MSSPLKQNTTTIQELLTKINSLPEASSGVELPELTNPGTAADLVEGKEFIDADGNVVTGTIDEVTAENTGTYGVQINGGGEVEVRKVLSSVFAIGIADWDYLIREGSRVTVSMPADLLGNAGAADVAEGKTFTSSSGVKITGTYKAIEGGGLPNGVSALTFGTFTPTSDCTSDWPIYHDLGQTPNFFLFYARDSYAALSDFAGGCFMQFAMPSRVVSDSALYSISFVSNNGTMYQTVSVSNELVTSLSSNLFVVDAATSRKLLSGVTYNWMCGIIDMED